MVLVDPMYLPYHSSGSCQFDIRTLSRVPVSPPSSNSLQTDGLQHFSFEFASLSLILILDIEWHRRQKLKSSTFYLVPVAGSGTFPQQGVAPASGLLFSQKARSNIYMHLRVKCLAIYSLSACKHTCFPPKPCKLGLHVPLPSDNQIDFPK